MGNRKLAFGYKRHGRPTLAKTEFFATFIDDYSATFFIFAIFLSFFLISLTSRAKSKFVTLANSVTSEVCKLRTYRHLDSNPQQVYDSTTIRYLREIAYMTT